MSVRTAAAVTAIAAARALLAFTLSLAFWAAVPAAWGWQPTSVMTASMSPAIQVGDVVVSRPVEVSALSPGRVVLADDPDHPERRRLHRIDGVRPDGQLVTKGDANPAVDSSPLRPEAVQGVGFLRVPLVGWPVVWARSGDGAALALTGAGLLGVLLVATRRGTDDDSADDDAGGPEADRTPQDPAEEPLPDQAPPSPATRRGRRALGLATAVVAISALGSPPAWAAFTGASSTTTSISAARLAAPSEVTCRNNGTAEIRWEYASDPPQSFSLLVDGTVVHSGIPATDRRASLPADRYYSIFSRARVTVRAEAGSAWTATSAPVTVGGVLFGFGQPFCV